MRGVPGSGNGGGAPDSDRKRSLRFTLETDIVLLQEVGRHKPWASPHGKIRDTWEQIAASVTATINSSRDESEAARVDHGASKRRYDSLMEAFVKDELKSMRAKGSPDLYVRREELLTDLSLQLSQHHDQKLKVKKQANGVAAAAAAAAGVSSSVISSTTTSSSPSPSSMFSGVKHPRAEPSAALPDVKRQAPPRADFDHLDERDVSGNRLKARELDLAERRLELDRARFESEREERSAFVASMQANTTLLMRLIDRLERPGANTISRDIYARNVSMGQANIQTPGPGRPSKSMIFDMHVVTIDTENESRWFQMNKKQQGEEKKDIEKKTKARTLSMKQPPSQQKNAEEERAALDGAACSPSLFASTLLDPRAMTSASSLPAVPSLGGTDKKLFVFGLGFSAARAALAFRKKGFEVAGTSRTQESALQLAAQHPDVFRTIDNADESSMKRNVFVFDGAQWDPANDVSVEQALTGVTHIIISVPTGRSDGQEDPVLYALREQLLASVSGSLQWLGYLSTIGVYGETHGVAVDESAPVQSSVKRSQMRIVAENLWLETGLPVHIFRIAGIYGPGRGTITKVRSGTATRIHIPGRMFNRIHVDDIVNILLASAAKPNSGAIYNVCDDEPAPADQVTAYACELLNVPMVPSQTWEEAEATMSAMAKTFYAESKITKNDRIKHELGVKLIYPSYREGLLAQLLEEEASSAEESKQLVDSAFNSFEPAETFSSVKKLVVLVNIGSLRPEPYLDLRQISFRLSRSLRLPVVPCSFRFSNRIDPSELHGMAAKSFEMVLTDHLNQYPDHATEVIVLPLFFGNSSTLTEFLPDVLTKCWNKFAEVSSNRLPLSLRLGGCLVNLANPADDRVAKILHEKVTALTADVSQNESISVIVLDHGTPNREVHEARELVGDQLRKLLKSQDQVKLVGTGCMERREGPEYDFNDPLLEVALDHYKITSGIVVITILFLSQGRHAGANGDIEEILVGVKEKYPNVEIRITEPLGTHELLSELLQDRYYQALSKPTPEYVLTANKITS